MTLSEDPTSQSRTSALQSSCCWCSRG